MLTCKSGGNAQVGFGPTDVDVLAFLSCFSYNSKTCVQEGIRYYDDYVKNQEFEYSQQQ